MSFRNRALLSCALMLAWPCFALAAQQVILGKVNTSVGLKNTAANQFKLITDPVLTPSEESGPQPSDYIPVEGYLDSHFDPAQFELNNDPTTGMPSLGSSVMGVLPYQVLGFEVQTVDGGLVDVQDNGEGGSSVTDITNTNQPEGTTAPNGNPLGPVGGGDTGNVFDIHFNIITDEEGTALTSDQDQDFYQLFLTQIGNNLPGDDTTFATPDSFVTFDPVDGPSGAGLSPITVTFPNIAPSVVPEVSSAGFIAFGGVALFLRRRRAKKESQALATQSSSAPPDQA